ncbi:alpha/beta hydrolase [Aquicoccus porphyridii]|uniref:Alpha/beta hydrolase n=1 Tax=Aquicoccus porphyridii TaxID=1852029 RepID=A0A5A9YYB7_9RHOB|nr:alpha/beta hydrolase [Aquicoccus porphyridii]KAA0909870.1 alpha/beta hydrolase [Aquicoccus porphyridii]RAI53219.1 esterase [Rhodobacteraceae bacterium AsT-22]
MSLVRQILNRGLRLFEKRQLARARSHEKLRRSFEFKARLFFHAPRGSRVQADHLNGVPVEWVSGPGVARGAGPILLYFHGGGYVFGSPRTHRAMLARVSGLSGLPACLPQYRLAPEHPFPVAVEDALSTYRAVAGRPGGVILGGDSAGGGLALALLGEILRQGETLPKGLFAFSPLTDLSFSGASIEENAHADVMLPPGRFDEVTEMYLPQGEVQDPRASPLLADFAGAPPVWLTVGDTEILRDDTLRIAERMRDQGVVVEAVLEHDLPHVWPIFQPFLPEAMATLRGLARWINSLSER